MNIQNFLADAPAGKEGGMYQMLIMFGLIAFFFYFVLWKPEQKRKKKQKTMRSSMKKGDQVVAMGMVAIIDEVKEKTVILKQVDGSKVEMLTAAISEIQTPTEQKS